MAKSHMASTSLFLVWEYSASTAPEENKTKQIIYLTLGFWNNSATIDKNYYHLNMKIKSHLKQ